MPEELKVPNNAEIDAALKEYERQKALESKSTSLEPETTPPLQDPGSGVRFEEDIYRGKRFNQEKALSQMAGLVVKFSGGSIKTEKQANLFLLIFCIVSVGISFLFFSSGTPKSKKPTQEEIFRVQNMPVNR